MVDSPVYPFDEIARPVWFEHDDPIFSIWAKGSSFLCADSEYFYWVTAAHVLANNGATSETVRIFPSDRGDVPLPFSEQISFNRVDQEEEYKDIVILRIDDKKFANESFVPLIAQDIDHGTISPESLAAGCELWIVGYAAENNYVDYEQAKIQHTRSVMRAVYKGAGSAAFCHVAQVESSFALSSFDGLSGSPLFYFTSFHESGNEVQRAVLVGILIRGTASSGLLHFVSVEIIRRMIRSRNFGPYWETGPTTR